MSFDRVEDAIQDIRDGKMVIVADDEDRENEGDLVCAAEKITPEIINFMATEGRGLICTALAPERADELDLRPMTDVNTEAQGTAFTISVDAAPRFGVTTGISASDRATTIRLLVDPETQPSDLRRPGHIFPIRARPGGVLRRVGQTEASVDLARMAGLSPAGVICEILNDDGTMARRPELEAFASAARAQVRHRRADRPRTGSSNERLVQREAEAMLPTPYRRLADHRLPQRGGQSRARRDGEGRGGGGGGGAGADALGVPDRRRLPLHALRLRRAARWPPCGRSTRRDRG
jgi:3,4-dihydroxy 2-butanone 4-phosphate synthase / GTP cyclohydrolase II